MYGVCLALLLFFLNWIKLRFVVLDHAFEVYIAIVALLFTGLGMWLALKLSRPTSPVVAATDRFVANETAIEKFNLSKRELEVLQGMAKGLSNQEIADQLFVSVSTVKSHCNNLFDKLDVRRRTQAIQVARRMGILP